MNDDNNIAYAALGVALLGLIFPRPSNASQVVVGSSQASTSAVGTAASPHRNSATPPTVGNPNANVSGAAMVSSPPSSDRNHRVTFNVTGNISALTRLLTVTFGAGSASIAPSLGYPDQPTITINDLSTIAVVHDFFAIPDATGNCETYDIYNRSAVATDTSYILDITVTPRGADPVD